MEWKASQWTNGIPFPKRWMKWNLLRAEGELQWALQGFRVSPAPGFQILKAGGLVWWKEEGQQDQGEDSHRPPWQQKQQHNHLLGGSDQLEPMFSTSLIPLVPFNQTLPVLRVKVVHFPEHGTSGNSLLVGSLSTSTTRTAASTTTSTTMLMARGSMRTVCVDAIIIWQ